MPGVPKRLNNPRAGTSYIRTGKVDATSGLALQAWILGMISRIVGPM